MSLNQLHEDDYGYDIRLTVKQDGTTRNISSYTTRQFLITDPQGNVTTKTAQFQTDGTDGVLTYTMESGVIDEPGIWRIQVRLSGGSATLTSEAIEFYVLPRLD